MANKLKQRKKNEKSYKEEKDDSDSGTGISNHNTETSLDNNVSLGVQNSVNSQELNYCSDNKNKKALCNGYESKSKKNLCMKNDQLCHKQTSMMKSQDKSAFFNHDCKPPAINFEVDFAAVVLFVIGICTRMWRLEEPKSIVFDELHYGKFVSMYMNRTFFFDTHPPLGKQLIALAGYLYGYNGENDFLRIGGDYQDSVPIHVLRAVPAFFGSLLIPTVYYLVRELGFTSRTAMLAGFLLIFENSYLTQSRFILMESMLIWFSTFGLLAYLKFRNSSRAFSLQWCGWLFLCSLSLSCAICVKYSGLFTAVLVVGLLVVDYWKMIADHSLNVRQLLLHLVTRVQAVFVVPIAVYLLVFYIHLEILIRAGPYDSVMTSAFQASLEGGLSSITKGQPLVVAHGSQVTLRHTHGRTCWLHSHPHVYPVRYRDQRGSSHQQQVTCYSFKDVNNWWIIKRPDVPELVASDPIDKIKHGDIIQLVHGMTIRTLNSHDVAAPMSPQNQEVSCYIDYNISFPAEDLWKVDITNRDSEGDVWNTIHSHVRLIHVNSGQALKFSGKQLPDWGFNQHEIVTDRVVNQYDTVWNVEEHRYTTKSDQKEREREIGMAEFVPLQPTKLSFFEKMWELQFKMLTSNSENVPGHIYSSEAMDWLFMTRGIAYWISHKSNAQIHLLGNIITWYTATLGVASYCCIFVFYMLRRRRQFYDIPDEVWNNFCVAGQVCFCGYLLNFLPYFFVDHVMFLHHYMPAYLFKLLLLVTFIEHISSLVCLIPNSFIHKLAKIFFMVAICIWVAAIMYTFNLFTALCYGTMPLTAEQVLKLRWKDTWDFIVHVT